MAKEITEQIRQLQETISRLNIHQSDDTPQITKQYGYIRFDHNELDSTIRLSQYIRLALHTDATKVVELMQKGWRLPTPNLIISVTGGGRQCHISTHLRKTFQRGLVAAAATTSTNVGVVKEVGEAISNYRYRNRKHGLDVPCIGICTWEYTSGSEQLSSPIRLCEWNDDSSSLAKQRRRSRADSMQMEVVEHKYVRSYAADRSDSKRCDLEPNHTHFLLFDGESTNNDSVLLQRAHIEQCSRQLDIQTSIANILIPIVMILVEGGSFSVRTVCHALRSNTPLVVVKGSGRAADLVSDLHDFFSQFETNKRKFFLPSWKEAELKTIIDKHRGVNNTWIDHIKDNLCDVLYHRKHLVVIFEFDSQRHHGNLEDAILEALFNATKFTNDNTNEQQCRVAELKLAMAWQKFDYAQKYILTDATVTKWTDNDLCQVLIDALRRDSLDFVELLMDYGTSLGKLTLNDLEQLYALHDNDGGLPLDKKVKRELWIRNNYYRCYFPEHADVYIIRNKANLNKNTPLGQNAARELFLWAIFLDRFQLAKYLCSKTWNQTVATLIAAQIYRLAATMAVHMETKQHYENNASEFDSCAMGIIDRCFDNDENFAVELLKQSAVIFNNIEPLKLAEQAKCRTFLASRTVQKHLDHEWYGHINYKRSFIHFRILLCSLFFPLLPVFSIFLPYVHKHQQIIRNHKHHLKARNPIQIQTIFRSDHDRTDESILWTQKIVYFYQAPIVRFCYNVIFFIIFLGLFSYVLLIDFLPVNVYGKSVKLPLRPAEIVLHICVWTLIMEELRQYILMTHQKYFSDMWNIIDLVAIFLYLLAFITRFIPNETFFTISKISVCLDLIVWFVGTLKLFAAFERLGPKLVMIFNTMKDLFFFVCFILIFLCAFSITSWSLITSASHIQWTYGDNGQLHNVTLAIDHQHSWSWKLLRDIANYGVWKVFGQVDPISGTDPYSNMAFILAIIFVAIANILLLNVLIALFNVTIQNVQEQSHDLWRYQRFSIVSEYCRKTLLQPPFNIVYYIFMIGRFLFVRLQVYRNSRRFISSERLLVDIKTITPVISQSFKISDSLRRERAIAKDHWHHVFKSGKYEPMKVILQNIEEKLDYFIPNTLNDNIALEIQHHRRKRSTNIESDV
ncbi:unnamed protein product [Adineta ricciae]|uniref:Uncharacterized protein n=1 Tax=Adineta ricciae TaxID=249248 RepID=A0A814IPD5_ADIRI|nr:unnamed protein product [Adineta ricciae]